MRMRRVIITRMIIIMIVRMWVKIIFISLASGVRGYGVIWARCGGMLAIINHSHHQSSIINDPPRPPIAPFVCCIFTTWYYLSWCRYIDTIYLLWCMCDSSGRLLGMGDSIGVFYFFEFFWESKAWELSKTLSCLLSLGMALAWYYHGQKNVGIKGHWACDGAWWCLMIDDGNDLYFSR